MNKKILKIIPIFLVLLLVVTPCVFGDGENGPISSSISNTGSDNITEIVSPVKKIYGSAIRIIEILAFTAIIFAGVRYMFASADSKANLKNSTISLIIGAVIVFGVTIVVDLVVTIVNEIL